MVVDDTPANVSVLLEHLSDNGFKVLAAEDGENAIVQIEYAKPDLVLLDIMMPGIDGHETLRRLQRNPDTRNIPVLFMTALSAADEKLHGFRSGAVDYITKPFDIDEVLARVRTHLKIQELQNSLVQANENLESQVRERTAQLTIANENLKAALHNVETLKERLEIENTYLREEIREEYNWNEIITESEALRSVLNKIRQVSDTDASVLILGETGTGKELIARSIHYASNRKTGPLVKINCAALPEHLIESELFGHEKGAFTGATSKRLGRFEVADGGTILLDEIGDLPLGLQPKLLRVLQDGEFERVGATKSIQVDVRVIAATNRDLTELIAAGDFREDLYYRLNVIRLVVPPLRDRREDITPLVQHFLNKFNCKMRKKVNKISAATMKSLTSYHWPGNVRELQNVIERSVIFSPGANLIVDDLIDHSRRRPVSGANTLSLKEVEKAHIEEVLATCDWKIEGKTGAAIRLEVPASTLRDRMKKLGIKKP